MKVYSPSQTTTWLSCPIKRELSYVQKVKTRTLYKRDLAGFLGTAVAAGAGAYHNLRLLAQPEKLLVTPEMRQACGGIAHSIAKTNMAFEEELGRAPAPWDRAQYLAIPERAAMGTFRYVDKCPIPSHWRFIDVERTFPNHGYCRLDLIADDGLGPVVVDVKCKLTLDSRHRQKEIDRYRNFWNMLHYTWTVSEFFGSTPTRYYIVFVILEPRFETWIEEYPVKPTALQAWEQSARRVWAQMEAEDKGLPFVAGTCDDCMGTGRADENQCPACNGMGIILNKAEPYMVAKHADEFGLCEYYGACFDHEWDPIRMAADYVRG